MNLQKSSKTALIAEIKRLRNMEWTLRYRLPSVWELDKAILNGVVFNNGRESVKATTPHDIGFIRGAAWTVRAIENISMDVKYESKYPDRLTGKAFVEKLAEELKSFRV